jgi:uncharacterized SAM-binding protein YcdF (DUF218 family)
MKRIKAFVGERRRARRIALTSAALLVVWCLVAWGAARWLVVSDTDASASRGSEIEVVAVLAGSSQYLERTAQAARIWREHRAARVVLTNDGEPSGWLSSEQRNPLFVERARWALEREGIPSERIEALPRVVSSTYEEAVALREYATMRGVRSLEVVTSPYHTRRAGWILRRVFDGSGVEIEVVAASPDDDAPTNATWWLHARGWHDVAGEYVKFAYYALNY